eukprot:GEMP01119985.1.p1 GENE.GEMP01119985.1~~GEMP01119985.1.p1  ORF type:complete len:152 (+),score=36.21 GEMP01119985.1:37-456(+)
MWSRAALTCRAGAFSRAFPRLVAPQLSRAFCTRQDDVVKTKVLNAVEKYLDARVKEVEKDMQEKEKSADLEKYFAALQSKVEETSTWADLGFDELDEVEVLLEVEEAFDHVIPHEISDTLKGVIDTIQYFEKIEEETAK